MSERTSFTRAAGHTPKRLARGQPQLRLLLALEHKGRIVNAGDELVEKLGALTVGIDDSVALPRRNRDAGDHGLANVLVRAQLLARRRERKRQE
eukprot:5523340-Prymnesium_polylepis.1